jgi:hypothetical protein
MPPQFGEGRVSYIKQTSSRQDESTKKVESHTIDPEVPSEEKLRSGIRRRLGYTDNLLDIPVDVSRQIHKALEMAVRLVKPKCICRVTPIEEIDENVIIGKGIQIRSQRWAKCASQMESPEVILVYAVTLGEELDLGIASIQKQSLSLGYILDITGSEIIERIADRAEEKFWKNLNLENFQRTVRFSPGYCDWGLDGQKEVFWFLRPEEIGISHTKGWSMLPSKSITAAILGALNTRLRSPCPLCNLKSCTYRIEKTS